MNHLRSPLCPTHIPRDPADSHSNASWWSSFGSLSLESVDVLVNDLVLQRIQYQILRGYRQNYPQRHSA